jgi:hypothetical protein
MANIDQIVDKDFVKTIIDAAKALGTLDDAAVKYFQDLLKGKEATDQITKLQKELVKQTETLTILDEKLNSDYVKNTAAINTKKKALADAIRIEGSAEGSLVRMRQKLSELTTAYDKAGTRTKAAASEIDKLSREIGKAEAATNRHQRGVGGYADQLGKLAGSNNIVTNTYTTMVAPIKSATTAMKGMSIAEALVLWPIALIVAAFVAVVAIFKTTDSGANSLKGAFEGVKNVIDILVDRAERLLRLDFKGAFGGAKKAIEEAAKAGYNYVQTMDDIEDREAASVSRKARMNKEIAELINLSKDARLSHQEQADAAKKALAMQEEVNGIELGFLKEKNSAEEKNIASKIQNDKLSIEQKEAQLQQWLLVDDKELNSLAAKDAAFAEFYNKNESAFQKLQAGKAGETDKEREVLEANRRVRTAYTADLVAIEEEKNKKVQEKRDADKKLAEANAQFIANQAQQEYDRQILLIQATATSKEDAENKIFEFKKESLKKTLSLLEIELNAFKGTELEKIALKEKLEKAKSDLEKVGIEQTIKDNDRALESRKKMTEDAMAWDKEQDEIEKENKKTKEEKDKEVSKTREEQLKAVQDQSIELAKSLFDYKSSLLDGEMQKLEEKNSKGLLSEKQFAREKAIIEEKQFKNNQAQALVDIAINTAVAVQKLWGTGGLAPILIGLAIASGLVQTGIVLSKKPPAIPAFFQGGIAELGYGTIAEKEPELMRQKSGKWSLWTKPGMFSGEEFKGARIYPGNVSKEMLSNSGHSGFNQNFNDTQIVTEIRGMRNDIKNINKPIYDKDRRVIGMGNENHQQIYLNRYKIN